MAYNRAETYSGVMTVYVADEKDRPLTDKVVFPLSSAWNNTEVVLTGLETAYGKLVIALSGEGSVDLDCIQFYDNDYWGCGNPKWSQGKMRKDLVLALKDLKPRFLRFPGGCLVEGIDTKNEYRWKDSVGALIDRKQDYNLWAYEEPGFAYTQSRQLGFYEFFLLCEDLEMEPVPVVWAGMNCQIRNRPSIPFEGKQFDEEVVQNALDLIEYANGDPSVSKWAKLRAEAGHPEPFGLRYIGIGNENYDADYIRRFRKVKAAIDESYPGIICILSAGNEPDGKFFEYSWQESRNGLNDVYVDEHFYKKPSWVIRQHNRYDHYPRDGAKVFLGEYAAYNAVAGSLLKRFKGNRYETALAEAAFMTGIERNSDVVAMSCYAPLLAQIGGDHWKHNLIYFNPKTVLRTANYYVQQMFGSTVGNERVPICCKLPRDIYASATKSSETLCIKLVNTGRSDFDIGLEIDNLSSCTKAKITVLQCDDLKCKNQLTYFGDIEEPIKPVTQMGDVNKLSKLVLRKRSVTVIEYILSR